MDKKLAVLESIRRRTESSISAGGDGYVETTMVSFDVGLNSKKVTKMLVEAMGRGLVEKKSRGPGRPSRFKSLC